MTPAPGVTGNRPWTPPVPSLSPQARLACMQFVSQQLYTSVMCACLVVTVTLYQKILILAMIV